MPKPITEVDLTPDERADQIGVERIDFDEAILVQNPGPGSKGPFLQVSGVLPCLNMRAELYPVRYIREPDYWAVHVYGIMDGDVCLEATKPFVEVLNPAPCGTKGIVVVGETKVEQLDC